MSQVIVSTPNPAPSPTPCRDRFVPLLELLLVALPASVAYLTLMAWAVRKGESRLLVVGPYLLGPTLGVATFWVKLWPRVVGRASTVTLSGWQLVGLALSAFEAVLLLFAMVTYEGTGPVFGLAPWVVAGLMLGTLFVAGHLLWRHDRGLA